MPNILLEYTSNVADSIDYAEIFAAIHAVLHETAGIRLDNCKSRATEIDQYYIGDGHPSNAFVQLTLSFLAGRSVDIKQALGDKCLGILKQYYEHSAAKLDLQITVELKDIERSEYFIYPEGTLTPQ